MAWCNDLDILTMSMYTSIMLSSLWIRIQSCHVLSKTDIYIFVWFLPSFCCKLTIKAYHVISVSLTCHHITYFLIVYSIAYTLGVPLGRLIYKCIYWCRLNTYIVSNNSALFWLIHTWEGGRITQVDVFNVQTRCFIEVLEIKLQKSKLLKQITALSKKRLNTSLS